MAIPDFQVYMLPLLQSAADGRDHALKELYLPLADIFGLTEAERRELLPSGRDIVFQNRVRWANACLKKAGLLQSPRRGYISITKRGKDVLSRNLPSIDLEFLSRFPEFREFRS
jgi:restriction system protein